MQKQDLHCTNKTYFAQRQMNLKNLKVSLVHININVSENAFIDFVSREPRSVNEKETDITERSGYKILSTFLEREKGCFVDCNYLNMMLPA